ncbi:hypothetical protein CEXT_759171 [Caerostris extrusa]|uniref:Uncharacterized protein n=1 Tax=Caerostris extrusa TaxID=172846 RepID=A0AAV4Q5H4_CAEEX|nr:hypothetical protein CEXT_759171 [Caerostris extrusa]
MGSTAAAVFRRDEICTYGITIRDLNPLMGSTAAAVFRRDEIMQLLSEIQIGLWALLHPLFSEMSKFCIYAITVRDSNPLMTLLQLQFSEI